MGSPSIRSSATCLIAPASPTAPEKLHLALTNLDLSESRIFTPVILLYEAPADADFQAIVGGLKESLRRALVEYYPFAGRMVRGTNGRPEVRCDDSGAYFTEVVVEEDLEELGGSDACVQLTGMEAANLGGGGWFSLDDHDELPPLVIQVTYFKGKAIALAVNWYHLVADGVSGMTFLKSWSELAQGLPITSPPDHRRQLLSPRTPPQPLEGAPPGYRVISAQPKAQEPDAVPSSKAKKVETRIPKKVEFVLSADEIQQLKKEGNASGPLTSGECISAHLWRLVTEARGLNREEITSIYTVIDGRKRMKDFPSNYFGNCVFVKKTTSSVAEVLDKPLGHAAKLIHDSISGATDDYVRAMLDWIEVTGAPNFTWDRDTLPTLDLQPTFWRYFPVYELDFGFGRPTYGGRNSPLTGSTGFAAVSPTPSRDGSVVISVFLYSDAADHLATTLNL